MRSIDPDITQPSHMVDSERWRPVAPMGRPTRTVVRLLSNSIQRHLTDA